MPGLIQDSASIAANAFVNDQLQGNVLATNRPLVEAVQYGIVASATGLRVALFVGTNQVTPEFAPSLGNRFPLLPDDMLGDFGLLPNDRLLMQVRNTTGGALTLFWSFRFNAVPMRARR